MQRPPSRFPLVHSERPRSLDDLTSPLLQVLEFASFQPRTIDLAGCLLRDEGLCQVIDTLDFSKVRTLDLSGCGITHDGLEYFLTLYPQLPELEHLNLSLNHISTESAELLVSKLDAPNLRTLHTARSMLSPKALRKLDDHFFAELRTGVTSPPQSSAEFAFHRLPNQRALDDLLKAFRDHPHALYTSDFQHMDAAQTYINDCTLHTLQMSFRRTKVAPYPAIPFQETVGRLLERSYHEYGDFDLSDLPPQLPTLYFAATDTLGDLVAGFSCETSFHSGVVDLSIVCKGIYLFERSVNLRTLHAMTGQVWRREFRAVLSESFFDAFLPPEDRHYGRP